MAETYWTGTSGPAPGSRLVRVRINGVVQAPSTGIDPFTAAGLPGARFTPALFSYTVTGSAGGSVQSASSYGTGGDASSVASSTDQRALQELTEREGADGIAPDLVDQRSLEDAVFASLFTLSKNRNTTDLRWTVARIVLEFLQARRAARALGRAARAPQLAAAPPRAPRRRRAFPPAPARRAPHERPLRLACAQMFRVVFNTVHGWRIDSSLWAWKAFYWLLFRFVVIPKGYDTYVAVFYCVAGVLLVAIALTVWVAVVLKKDDTSSTWLRRLVGLLQWAALILFSVFWVAILSVSDCDLNPLTRSQLASPVALTGVKTMALKMAMVLVSTVAHELGHAQFVVMLACAGLITYVLLTTVPYYYDAVNYAWVGLWAGITFTNAVLVALAYTAPPPGPAHDAYAQRMTMLVLYGIFPAVLVGAAVSWAYVAWRRMPTPRLAAAAAAGEAGLVLRDVYRFKDVWEAEFLLRVMRKWDEDGVPDPDTTALGAFILRCAMARLPGSATLLTLQSNFIIETRKDGQAARTQLQLAAKAAPALVERYFIYVSQEVAKKLKSESEGLDLVGYVEFQRSYRACVRAHKLALTAQRQFWHSMLRDNVSFRELQSCFEAMSSSEGAATAVYRRVMERYPTNGKLLKIYGRFLEYGTSESLLGLAGSSAEGESISAKLNSLLGAVDEKSDSLVIINAAGVIMMVNGPARARPNAPPPRPARRQACCRLFGYEKGELDGKNVSTLMPQPFSSRHNSYLQRARRAALRVAGFTNTGTARILNATQQVVALRKDLSVFPVTLVVTRLSGVGSDSIFMGVLRADNTASDTVKIWATPTGTVLCTDERFRDFFGLASKEVVGRAVSSLTTDVEAFARFIATASELPAEDVEHGALRLRTRLLHKYLAPLDAEASIEFGGTEEQRILVIHLRCSADGLALLVTDAKGRITFATSQLAAMLGYSARTLADGMNLAGLLPPPHSQLHAAHMKDLSSQPGPGSCRAGAVVHLLHANNSKVPVTLQLSQNDDGEHLQHVMPASEGQLLDQARLELSLNHRGVVLGVNAGAARGVFGFSPAELVGRPLPAFVNVFGQWRTKFGEDESLLVMLGMRAEQGQSVVLRVGVHCPLSDAELERGASSSGAGGATASSTGENKLLGALRNRHKERAAVLTMALVHPPEDGDGTPSAVDIDATPVLTVSLWRAEGLTSLLEVDGKLGVLRVEPSAGLMFGVAHTALLRKSFKNLVGLPSSVGALELLGGSGKKGMLKEGGAWRMGQPRTLEASHVDGSPVKLQMQARSAGAAPERPLAARGGPAPAAVLHPRPSLRLAHATARGAARRAQAVSKDGKGSHRLLITLRLLEPSMGSLAPLLALRAAGLSGNDAPPPAAALLAQRADSDSDGGSGERAGSAEPDNMDSRQRVAQWVSSSFRKGDDEDPAAALEGRGRHGSGAGATRRPAALDGPPAGGYGSPGRRGSYDGPPARGERESPRAPRGGIKGPSGWRGSADGAPEGGDGHGYVEVRLPGRASFAPGGKPGADARSDAGSEAPSGVSGSQSQGVSEEQDDATEATSNVDEELVVDWRRAKRLKKLNRMMTSTAAQVAAERFRRHTYLLTLVIVLAHTVCFVVLLTQINARYQTAYEVSDMAQATERSQMMTLRANFIQKCGNPTFADMEVCSADNVEAYIAKIQENYSVMRAIHQGLYLGYEKLKKFRDPRLMVRRTRCARRGARSGARIGGGAAHVVQRGARSAPPAQDHWTYEYVPEYTWYAETANASKVLVAGNNTLWEIGNKFLHSSKEVEFNARALRYELHDTNYWNYIYQNGPASLFEGYMWSLDVFVDYAWSQLGTLNNVLVVLLIVECFLVQLSTICYEFVLVKAANCEAMKRFSVFLALPSATIRSMASRQLQARAPPRKAPREAPRHRHRARPGSCAAARRRAPPPRRAQVDDDDKSDLDDDELEAINATAAATDAGDAAGGAKEEGKGKSVRMSVAGAPAGECRVTPHALCVPAAGAAPPSVAERAAPPRRRAAAAEDDGPSRRQKLAAGRGKPGALAGHKAPRSRWAGVGKFLFGWASTTFKINGKKLVPHSGVLWRFMVPLLLWVAAVIIIFGVSFQKLQGLQGPLASLNAAAHVRFRLARVRLIANVYAFAETPAEMAGYRDELRYELGKMRSEYESLLYGGAGLHFNAHAPAAAFVNSEFSNIFFKTSACLRHDASLCYAPGSPWYDITHAGLDAMALRAAAPPPPADAACLPRPAAPPRRAPPRRAVRAVRSYMYVTKVAGLDMYEGLQTAATLFVEYTISRFEQVKQLHIILLAVTLVLVLGFVVKLFRPFVVKLHAESKAMAGMMSQLPAEVDIEGHIKTHLLGIRRDDGLSMRAPTDGPSTAVGAGPGAGPGGRSLGLLPQPPPGRFFMGSAMGAGSAPGASPRAPPGPPQWDDDDTQQPAAERGDRSSRRALLGGAAALGAALAARRAAAGVQEDLERVLPAAPTAPAAPLPKAYQRTMRRLVTALRTSIEAEAGGAKEFEVRRKADGAKDLVKEFVGKWQDNGDVAFDASHDEMKGALSELGRFYQRAGPRSRLDEATKSSVLAHLAAVEAALPAEEKSLLGL
ncbi:tmcC [Scenedesmus sp. PABB004]|nr:tmcC [Scenedesmus sp. PABB004]